MSRLGVLTGQHPDALREKMEAVRPVPSPRGAVAVGLPTDVLRQRPDIRRAERQLASQHARIGVASGELYPIFTLPGTLSWQASETGDFFSGGNLAYSIGPAFRWNLFNAGRVRNNIEVEKERTQQAMLAYEQTVLSALEETENAMVALKNEQRRLQSLTQAVSAADKSVELVKTLYKSGLTNFQNVLDLERSLAQQQDNLAASLGQVSQNLVGLYRALGGGWQEPETEPAPEETAVEETPPQES